VIADNLPARKLVGPARPTSAPSPHWRQRINDSVKTPRIRPSRTFPASPDYPVFLVSWDFPACPASQVFRGYPGFPASPATPAAPVYQACPAVPVFLVYLVFLVCLVVPVSPACPELWGNQACLVFRANRGHPALPVSVLARSQSQP